MKDLIQCIVLCCEEKKCDVAFRVKEICYLVDCKNTYLCQPVLSLNADLTPEISYVTHNLLQKKQNNELKNPFITATLTNNFRQLKWTKKPNSKDTMLKRNRNLKKSPTFRLSTSQHKLQGKQPALTHKPKFRLASMNSEQNGAKRVTINQQVSRKPIWKPVFFFDQQKHKISKQQQQQQRQLKFRQEMDDDRSCYPTKIHSSVSLQYGPDSGDFYDYGEIGNAEECIDLCCEDKQCDVAFMIGKTCYTVSCITFQKCRMVPASKNAKLTSKLAYVVKKSDKEKDTKLNIVRQHEVYLRQQLAKEKELQERLLLASMPEADSNIPESLTKSCKYSTIKKDHTLVGGSKAGIFNYRGKTPGFQACLDLCCTDLFCDAAFLLGRKCYSVQCYRNNSCEGKPVKTGNLHSILAFVDRPDDFDINESKLLNVLLHKLSCSTRLRKTESQSQNAENTKQYCTNDLTKLSC